MAASVSASSTGTLLPSQGLRGQTRGLLWKKKEQRFARKAVSNVITAKVELKPPPYPMDALEPLMSRNTLDYHWGKHHRAYVDNLNKQITGTELDSRPLEEVVIATYNKGDTLPSFNNAAQAWNHEFFWESMKPNGGGKPSGELLSMIERDFGSFEKFVEGFKSAAATQFGSGWAWLVYTDKKLAIVKSPNAVNPLVWDQIPLLTIDVWEHAYYLDFQNRRPDYISTFVDKLVSWEAVSSRLEAAKAYEAKKEDEQKRQEVAGDDTVGEAAAVLVESDGDDGEAD